MAEVKNAFIKSKMNKDLDARLLPNGEYREGINIQVSKSVLTPKFDRATQVFAADPPK